MEEHQYHLTAVQKKQEVEQKCSVSVSECEKNRKACVAATATNLKLENETITNNLCHKTEIIANDLKRETQFTDSKIKLSILNLKLWIITAVILFLFSGGSTFVCAIKSYGNIEERVKTIAENQKSIETQLEVLRKEIYKLIPIGQYRQEQASEKKTLIGGGMEANEFFRNDKNRSVEYVARYGKYFLY